MAKKSMVFVLSEILLEKSNFSFTSGYQLERTSILGI